MCRGLAASWIALAGTVVVTSAPARAQGDLSATAEDSERERAAEPGPVALGYAALPGGLHAPSAETLPRGTFAMGALGGFGWRTGLLGGDHRFGRGIGDLAFAYAPTSALSIALALDGRYDQHFGLPPSGDDGYVGDPRLIARFAAPVGRTTRLGAQLGIWVPGKAAPSIAPSAISVDARALASFRAGPAMVSLSGGFRFDNSRESIDDPATLSLQDRVSLGVSEFHAVLASAQVAVPAGRMFVSAEASVDYFVGDGAPGPLIRGALLGGVHLTPRWSALVFVEAAKVPAIDAGDVAMSDIPLIAYEPMITGGLGLAARFGGPARRRDAHVVENATKRDIEVVEYAEVSGVVVDDHGAPVVGARVTVKLRNHTATGATGEDGKYVVPRIPIGKTIHGETSLDDAAAEISIEVDGKKPAVSTRVLGKGPNALDNVELEPMLPPGEVRAVVTDARSGKPIANATITIEPGGFVVKSGADGKLSIHVPPGKYKATAVAPGFKAQTLDVTLDANDVAIKNFELSR